MNAPALPKHAWLPHWLRECGHVVPIGDHRVLKQALAMNAISGRGWKFYAEYGDALFRPLGSYWIRRQDPEGSLANALDYLRLLMGCETSLAPPKELVASLQDCNLLDDSIARMPVAIFRGAWSALIQSLYLKVDATSFVREEFVPAMQWYFAQSAVQQRELVRGKGSWHTLRRSWAAYARSTALPSGPVEWSTPVAKARIGDLIFIPLRSESMLADEGKAMRNCVVILAEFCRSGSMRVFSLRDGATGRRVATLSINARSDAWELGDLKGPSNMPPEPDVVCATSRFIELLGRCVSARSQTGRQSTHTTG